MTSGHFLWGELLSNGTKFTRVGGKPGQVGGKVPRVGGKHRLIGGNL